DRTPPELVVFEAVEPDDPRRVRVAASDRTSGVAGGSVEVRRLGGSPAAAGDGWIALRTVRDGDRLLAAIDDEALPRGVYQLRAHAVDVAGNEAIGDRRRDGSVATFDTATLRSETRLAAGLVTPEAKARRTCVRRPGGRKRCRKAPSPAVGGALVATLTVPFGKPASARGTLATAGGAPIPGAPVDVLARAASAGSSFAVVDRRRTDAAGNVAYTVRPGPGRVIRFRYAGSPRERGSQGEVTVKVPAVTTIRPGRRAVRNGQRVTFAGRLRTQPIPRAGKLVDLQAFYRGRWRTFATPRAAAPGGAWRYVYRFGATRGRVTYRFRAVVRPESGYAYELGYSKVVRVGVVGR
ncbi:MAG TPA: hypothetical protein VF545_10190, partial [Thermoleophilaceae bacterium]